MKFRPHTLFVAGVVAGCLVGTAATVGVLYHRPGSAAMRRAGRILGLVPRPDGSGRPGARAASGR
jgi:hypothetical protein